MNDTSSIRNERTGIASLVWIQFAVIIVMGIALWHLFHRQQAIAQSLEVDQLRVKVITLLDQEGNRVGVINGGYPANSVNTGSAPSIQLLSPEPASPNAGMSRQIEIGFINAGPRIEMMQPAKQQGAGVNALVTTLGAISTQAGVYGLNVFSSDGESSSPWQGIQLYFSDSSGDPPNEYYCRLPETYEVVKKRNSNE